MATAFLKAPTLRRYRETEIPEPSLRAIRDSGGEATSVLHVQTKSNLDCFASPFGQLATRSQTRPTACVHVCPHAAMPEPKGKP